MNVSGVRCWNRTSNKKRDKLIEEEEEIKMMISPYYPYPTDKFLNQSEQDMEKEEKENIKDFAQIMALEEEKLVDELYACSGGRAVVVPRNLESK